MFSEIAHRYDFLNRFLSGWTDQYWRWRVVRLLRSFAPKSPAACLDLCAGTGDLALKIARAGLGSVVAADFSHPMLVRSNAKFQSHGMNGRIRVVEADALRLPFQEGQFDVVTVAFGLRNLQGLRSGLSEMHRVLRSGGVLVVLEFSRPVVPLFRELFGLYFRHVLPRIGSAVSGVHGPYQYLHSSVQGFPAQEELRSIMGSLGFESTAYRNLTGGIAAIHWGRKK